ncbi:copper resistance CopC family protein [Streptosporangium sp. NPDC051022]|uniref:copper resistance CopC family protein n=1 Tax=Streptosporangium sp. NPDC051022 TaxID=3155752 RepID=UPI003441636D
MAFLPRFIRLSAVTALCCTAFLLLGAPAALAHDRLKSSSPAKNATVATVERIKLEFTSGVHFPTVVLRRASGASVDIGKAKTSGDTVTSEVPEPLSPGRYVIAWRVVSSDGHPIDGEIPFTVTGSATPSATPVAESTPSPSFEGAAPAAPPVAAQPPSPAPVSAADDRDAPSAVPVWIWGALAVLVAIGAGVWLRTSRQNRSDTEE